VRNRGMAIISQSDNLCCLRHGEVAVPVDRKIMRGVSAGTLAIRFA
jgi:hypothetical protein